MNRDVNSTIEETSHAPASFSLLNPPKSAIARPPRKPFSVITDTCTHAPHTQVRYPNGVFAPSPDRPHTSVCTASGRTNNYLPTFVHQFVRFACAPTWYLHKRLIDTALRCPRTRMFTPFDKLLTAEWSLHHAQLSARKYVFSFFEEMGVRQFFKKKIPMRSRKSFGTSCTNIDFHEDSLFQ